MNNKEAILFINANKTGSSREALKIVKDMGYTVIVLTDRKQLDNKRNQLHEVDELYYIEDLKDLQTTKLFINTNLASNHTIKQIISFVDGYVYIASKLSDYFCHNRLNSKSLLMMENKLYTRFILRDEPFNLKFRSVKSKMDLDGVDFFPCILKSISSSASRNLFYIESKEDLELLDIELHKGTYMVEEYAEGEQFLIECLVINNEIKFMCKVKQFKDNEDHIITDYIINPNQNVSSKELRLIDAIINTFGVHTGIFHVEYIKNENGLYLIEINPRISGGTMNKMILYALGFNYVKVILNVLLNQEARIRFTKKNIVYTHHFITDVSGLFVRVKKENNMTNPHKGVIELYIKVKPGESVHIPRHMGDRIGYVITTGMNEQGALHNALHATKALSFEVVPFE